MDSVERKLLDKLYALMQWERDELDPALRAALERDICGALIALRLWRQSRDAVTRAEGDRERYTDTR
jgi:hypothetical protein